MLEGTLMGVICHESTDRSRMDAGGKHFCREQRAITSP
jgi:hypothetical protein